jgi:hypothetical protein
MDFINQISPDGVMFIPVLLAIGKLLKTSNLIRDNYIPIILFVIGLGVALGMYGFNTYGFFQGVMIGLTPTGIHQGVTQLTKSTFVK